MRRLDFGTVYRHRTTGLAPGLYLGVLYVQNDFHGIDVLVPKGAPYGPRTHMAARCDNAHLGSHHPLASTPRPFFRLVLRRPISVSRGMIPIERLRDDPNVSPEEWAWMRGEGAISPFFSAAAPSSMV